MYTVFFNSYDGDCNYDEGIMGEYPDYDTAHDEVMKYMATHDHEPKAFYLSIEVERDGDQDMIKEFWYW